MVYLGSQLAATHQQRFDALLEYMPEARTADWEEVTAGQRVQVIAPDKKKHGVLQFGTQLITAADGSIGGMLGASPGASTRHQHHADHAGTHVPPAHRRPGVLL